MSANGPIVDIERMVPGGFGLARLEGRVVLVRGAIPGERVRVAIDRGGKGGVAFAHVDEVVVASPDRVVPDADPRCGGLALAHVSEERQRALKLEMLADALRRTGRLVELPEVTITASPVEGWRMRARLHVQGGALGFYREGTHELCDPPVSQLPPALRAAAEAAFEWTPAPVRKAIVDVVAAADLTGEQVAVCLTLERATPTRWPDRPPPGVRGVAVTWPGASRPSDVAGAPVLSASLASLGVPGEAAAGQRLEWHPAAFFQANRAIVPALVARVLAALDERPVIDLFAGVGLFGVCAGAGGAASVTCVEGEPFAARWLDRNARAFASPRIRTYHAAVEDFVKAEGTVLDARVIVVDPPRTGLPAVVRERLAGARDTRIVYVSCDAPTFARDLRHLTEAGCRLASVEAFDMFPQTAHLEMLAVLEPRQTPATAGTGR